MQRGEPVAQRGQIALHLLGLVDVFAEQSD